MSVIGRSLCHSYIPASLPVLSDITLTEIGLQERDRTHREGPVAKTSHILQYVSAGKGKLRIRNRTYALQTGDLFYLPKNIVVAYEACRDDPYIYRWVGFDGVGASSLLQSIGLTPDTPVYRYNDARITEHMERLYKYVQQNNLTAYAAGMGVFFDLLSLLLSYKSENTQILQDASAEYVNKAMWVIRNKFADDINVTAIAAAIGLGRNHFSTLFCKHTGMPPVKYLMHYRISQAQKMLKQGMSVTDTAISCGFNSLSNFSVQFKKMTGKTPLQYKNEQR